MKNNKSDSVDRLTWRARHADKISIQKKVKFQQELKLKNVVQRKNTVNT